MTRTPTSGMRLAVALLVTSLSNGCSEVLCGCSPPEPSVAGSYNATRFRFTPAGQATVDALAAGAAIALTLRGNGTTSGSLIVPAGLNGGVAQTLDLTGTLQFSGSQVTFSHQGDTFLRDVPWTVGTNTLVTNGAAGGVQFDVVLTRN